jgi:hypothetical protein
MPKKISDMIYSEGAISEDSLTDNTYENCSFLSCTFEGGHANSEFVDCKFEGCEFDYAMFNSCVFSGCTILDYDFKEVNFDHSSFLYCELGSSTFEECSLYGVVFDRCDMGSVTFLNSDAQFVKIVGKDNAGLEFVNTDLSEADLSELAGLTRDQIRSAFGNSKTALPEGLKRPDHWFDEEPEAREMEGIPRQQPAPLRVIWRDQQLVSDPRGGVQDQFGDPALMTLFRALSKDFSEFLAKPPTNHPVIDRIRILHLALVRGATSLNPAEIGYHLEVLRAQLKQCEDEITPPVRSSISGLVSGGFLLINQFEEWRELALSADAVAARDAVTNLSGAILSLARATEASQNLFDRRISESLGIQANDVSRVPNNDTVKRAAINSSGNVLSALAGKVWKGGRDAARTVTDEATKETVKIFFEGHKEEISSLIEQAPSTLGWLDQIVDSLL